MHGIMGPLTKFHEIRRISLIDQTLNLALFVRPSTKSFFPISMKFGMYVEIDE